jgi:hypothetical protein
MHDNPLLFDTDKFKQYNYQDVQPVRAETASLAPQASFNEFPVLPGATRKTLFSISVFLILLT